MHYIVSQFDIIGLVSQLKMVNNLPRFKHAIY